MRLQTRSHEAATEQAGSGIELSQHVLPAGNPEQVAVLKLASQADGAMVVAAQSTCFSTDRLLLANSSLSCVHHPQPSLCAQLYAQLCAL